MRFELGLISLLSIAFFNSPAAAVDAKFHSAVSCQGASINAYNLCSNCCAVPSAGLYSSVYFQNIPSGAKCQVYANGSSQGGCNDYLGEAGAGSVCINASAPAIRSANWFYPSKRLVRKEKESPKPTRYSVTYELPDKSTNEVEITAREVERAWELLEAKDYEALSKYPKFVR